ncbi:hypothetical protein M231_03173 [Tremella mesenterica]|uniref:C2H2-type domain-containing protein n=1 Tax=Tremella mesenterica TaxID=5217 RepID=A0A4Q1BNQ4_TREME|nr:hypothetical protein M231_03173 [Tremella mesenterica]
MNGDLGHHTPPIPVSARPLHLSNGPVQTRSQEVESEMSPEYRPYQWSGRRVSVEYNRLNSPAFTPMISSSPTTNPHAGFHPSSFGASLTLTNAILGGSSSNTASSLGMSVSPPRWPPGNPNWGPSNGFVGSLGGQDVNFGRERERKLETEYANFTCCGRRLDGLHELLKHYEEEHGNMVPDLRMASMGMVHPPIASAIKTVSPQDVPAVGATHSVLRAHHGEVPTPPGVMDIEMEDSTTQPDLASLLANRHHPTLNPSPNISPATWSTAFRPQVNTGLPQCLPPSLLSYAPPFSAPASRSSTPIPDSALAKAARKAHRKADRMVAREEASVSDAEGEKRFPCPIEGCGKVYKQSNGLRYHLTRSINSGHGNVAALGGLVAYLGERGEGA